MLGLCRLALSTGLELQEIPLRDYSVRRCTVDNAHSDTVLRVLDAVYLEDTEIVTSLCRSTDIAKHFGAVEVRSVYREELDLRDIYETRYGLVLAKPEMIDTLGGPGEPGAGYALLGRYPEYGSQLVSLSSKPELSAQWLRGKRLGLLDDPNSVSAYQIPWRELERVGLNTVPEIVYFRSFRQLYLAFSAGEVDIIPWPLGHELPDDRQQLPPGLILAERLPGPAWYVALGREAHCAIARALGESAAQARVAYFRGLRLEGDCHAE